MCSFRVFRVIPIAVLFFIAIFATAQSASLEEQILGIWQVALDSEQLEELGVAKSELDDSDVEMGFFSEGQFEMRIVNPSTFGTNTVQSFEGIYDLEDDRLKMSFLPGIWEDQEIRIDENVMSLAPREFDGEVINHFKRLEGWSLAK